MYTNKLKLKTTICLLATLLSSSLYVSCNKDKIALDYANEVLFETALNDGEDTTNKIVLFTAGSIHEQIYGYIGFRIRKTLTEQNPEYHSVSIHAYVACLYDWWICSII